MIGLQESIKGLNDHIGALEGAIGASSFAIAGGIPNPGSRVNGGEITGGTFTTNGGVHSSLGGELHSMNEYIGSSGVLGVSGAGLMQSGSAESNSIRGTGVIGAAIGNKLEKVKDTVNDRVQNILTLQTVLDNTFDNLLSNLGNSGDSADIENIKFVKEKINEALNNETQALQKLLQTTIKPSAESIRELVKKNATFAALADSLGVDYDTDEGSDRLAIAYTNLSNTGLAVEKVKHALKTLEMTVNDYSQLKNSKELEDKLTKILKTVNKPSVKSKLSKILDAIQILRNSQYNHSNVIECLKDDKKCLKTGYGEGESSEGESSEALDIGGGKVDGELLGRVRKFKTKSTLSRNIKTYEKTLKELFKSFMSQVNTNFKEIQKAIENVAEEFGASITYDEKIKNFVNIFESLGQDMNRGELFYALIAFDDSIGSKALKTRFLTNLDKLIESLNELKSYKYLNEIQRQLMAVKETIDTYTDTVTGFKNNEVKVKEGGDDFYWTNKILDQSVTLNVSKLINDTITKLKFYGNISQMKNSLNSTLNEFTSYKEDYDKLLGKSIGTKINELTREYNENVDRLHNTESNRGLVLYNWNNGRQADEQIPKGLVETIYKLQYDAKVGLYKTVEAIDLYLMNFTELLSGNVEATKELNKMLQQTEVISKWYNKNSGDKLFTLMEKVIYDNSVNNTANDVKTFITGKTIKEVLELCKESIDSVSMLKNILSMFVHIGDKFGNKTLSKEMYMSPNIMYKNLIKYIWVSAFTMGYGTGGGDNNAALPAGHKKDKNRYENETGDKSAHFNVHFTQLVDGRRQNKEILGDDGVTTVADAAKVATDAAKVATDAATDAATAAKVANDASSADTSNTALAAAAKVATDAATAANAAKDDATKAAKAATDKVMAAKATTTTKSSDIFQNDDIYFVLVMKAITAKILTVIGTAHILRQPKSVVGLITNPIRSIIGGSKDPEIVDDAFELYIRLPLLVEFYKHVFEDGNNPYKRGKSAQDDIETIAYIPEIGSIWSGLIQCIFDESRYIKDGIYSIDNMKRIIAEVNNIYKNYKNVDKNKLVRTVVLDLVADVNKRYGVLKKQEITEFYKLKKKYAKNSNNSTSTNHVNFDILDENNEFEDAGPSSKYTENIFSKSSNENILTNDIKLVKDFHNKIHAELFSKKNDLKDLSKTSFTEKIRFFKNELKNNTDNKMKLNIIIKAIDDSSNINSHNNDASLLFHELVAAPIKNLQAIHTVIDTMFEKYLPRMAKTITNTDFVAEYNANSVGATMPAAGTAFNKITLTEFLFSYLSDLDNLASIKFISNNKFVIDYSKLQNTVETSIENIKYMISKFRSQLSEEIIKKYETCLLTLEDKLLLKIINSDDNNDDPKYDLYNFDYLNSSIAMVLDSTKSTSLVQDLYKSIMFRATDKSDTKLLSTKKDIKIWHDIFAQYGGSKNRLWVPLHIIGTSAGAAVDDFSHLNTLYDNLSKVDGDSSILYGFNSLVYEYLCTFYDESTKKIYNNLFNEFVNKSQSSVIFGRKGVPDIKNTSTSLKDVHTSATNTFIENDYVLCETLGYMFKTIVNRTTNVQLPTKNHLLSSLSEVSPNVVEKYKVYLPVFIKLFETLIHKSLLCKKVLETTDSDLLKGTNIEASSDNDREIEGDMPGDKQRFTSKWSVGNIYADVHFNNTLNNIIDASRALINDATNVLAEINTKQQFFEIKENFIKNYYNNNNTLPLMPLSINTIMLQKDIKGLQKTLMPYPNKLDNEFKLLYGMNSVINNKALDNSLNSYIWLKEELKNYNNSSLSVNKIDVAKVNDYIEMNNKLSISLASVVHYNQFLNETKTNAGMNFNPTTGDCADIKTYYTSLENENVTLISTIDSVDNTSITNTKNKISNIINSSSAQLDISRVKARFLNILDLNIVPLNIHALMREIPLTNIYNYAFTYDHIVKQLFGKDYGYGFIDAGAADCNDLLLKLFLNPYYKNCEKDVEFLKTLLGTNGTNAKLGRSKYISDILTHAIGADPANIKITDSDSDLQKLLDASKDNAKKLHTKYFRNLIFLTNLQRLIHYKIKNEVEIINSKVVSDIAIANSQIVNYDDVDHPNLEETDFEYFMSDD